MFDEEKPDNVPKVTDLDIQRLQDLTEGNVVFGECGNWSVHHYGDKGGICVFTLSPFPCLEFKDILEVMKFLKGQKVNNSSFKQISI